MTSKATIVTGVVAGVSLVSFWAWYELVTRIRYVVGRDSLRVVLFGRTLRRIPFEDIERVRKPSRPPAWSETENWRSAPFDRHRMLILERRTGWFRKFVITPRHRYELRRQLRDAIAKSTGRDADSVDRVDPGDTDVLDAPDADSRPE